MDTTLFAKVLDNIDANVALEALEKESSNFAKKEEVKALKVP